MRRRRRRWTPSSILSLMLCTAVSATMLRSYVSNDWWPASLQGNGVQLHVWRGRAFLIWFYQPRFPKAHLVYVILLDGASTAALDTAHPNPGQDDLIEEWERQRRSFSMKQAALQTDRTGGWGSLRPSVSWHGGGAPPNAQYGVVSAPLWQILLLAAVPLWWGWILPRSRARAGHCLSCGYNLRATPQRCPECGNATGVSAASV